MQNDTVKAKIYCFEDTDFNNWVRSYMHIQGQKQALMAYILTF